MKENYNLVCFKSRHEFILLSCLFYEVFYHCRNLGFFFCYQHGQVPTTQFFTQSTNTEAYSRRMALWVIPITFKTNLVLETAYKEDINEPFWVKILLAFFYIILWLETKIVFISFRNVQPVILLLWKSNLCTSATYNQRFF